MLWWSSNRWWADVGNMIEEDLHLERPVLWGYERATGLIQRTADGLWTAILSASMKSTSSGRKSKKGCDAEEQCRRKRLISAEKQSRFKRKRERGAHTHTQNVSGILLPMARVQLTVWVTDMNCPANTLEMNSVSKSAQWNGVKLFTFGPC